MSERETPGSGPARTATTALDQPGARVSLRRVLAVEDGSPRLGDVVGVVERTGPTSVQVRRRDGSRVEVARADVVGARVVPAHPRQAASASYALSVPMVELEQVAALGWLGTEQGHVGDWLLRAGHGFTGRANSALPVGDPGRSIQQAVDEVIAWYSARGLPTLFQVPFPGAEPVDAVLDERGFEDYSETLVLVADLLPLLSRPSAGADAGPAVRLDPRPDDGWLSGYHYRGGALPAAGRAVIESGSNLAFASVRSGSGTVLANARGSADGCWLGVTAVEVDPSARRRGLASLLLVELARWAHEQGALAAYLQVAVENTAAQATYASLGFVEHHRYHYRRLT